MPLDLKTLRPGDILLCAGIEIVRLATNSLFGHVAIYLGDGVVITSLTRSDVNYYDLTEGAQEILSVRRPKAPLDLTAARAAFEKSYRFKPYGWGDCAGDVGLPNSGGGYNCSHISVQFLEDAGAPQFDPTFNKAKITPRDLPLSAASK